MDTEDHVNPLVFKYDEKETEFYAIESKYAYLRLNEFLDNTCMILNRRLTPGFAKDGIVHLVGADWRILDRYFRQFKCNKSSKIMHPTVNRKRIDVIYNYYEFNDLPDLGVDGWWIVKHEPNEEFSNYSESFYTKLLFVVCTCTKRVWARYRQITVTEQGFITAYLSCKFSLTICFKKETTLM